MYFCKSVVLLCLLLWGGMLPQQGKVGGGGGAVKVTRLAGNPIITPQTDPSLGTNINGPTLIRVPAWVKRPLGAYYLYFADHRGKYIRLAYADRLTGPWHVYIH